MFTAHQPAAQSILPDKIIQRDSIPNFHSLYCAFVFVTGLSSQGTAALLVSVPHNGEVSKTSSTLYWLSAKPLASYRHVLLQVHIQIVVYCHN
jgi:hypothetical protein